METQLEKTVALIMNDPNAMKTNEKQPIIENELKWIGKCQNPNKNENPDIQHHACACAGTKTTTNNSKNMTRK